MSQVTLGPPRVLDGPAPVPPRYSLLTVATIIEDLIVRPDGQTVPDEHWMAGAQIYPYPSREDGAAHGPCATGTEREKLEGGVLALPEFGAFTVYVAETCTARGIGDNEAFMNRAVVALNGLEAALVEHEFQSGTALPENPHLGDADVDILTGSPLGPMEALAQLENAIATTGKMGVVHTDPGTATAWAAEHVVEREGANLRAVATGTPIVVGYGYVGTAPLGESAPADTEGWAYATGPIHIRRSNIEMLPGSLAQALDRQNNVVTYRAERHYLVDWDTELQAAVLVDRT
jgi:hypothetical protein